MVIEQKQGEELQKYGILIKKKFRGEECLFLGFFFRVVNS